MSDILANIVAHKMKEVAERKQQVNAMELERMPLFKNACTSLTNNLLQPNTTGIIAEFKRQSPSKGIINNKASVYEVTHAYTQFGAAGISVLTDTTFFGGSLADLSIAVQQPIPVLRKEFIIDEFQILEAKAYGASVILLIAACLTPAMVFSLATTAKGLGMEVLLELHDASELSHICPQIDMVGVNNRSLKSFEVTIDHSLQLKDRLPKEMLCIAESGIYDITTYHLLKKEGFDGFLMGEYFMKQESPAKAFETFSQQIKWDQNAN
jgi:indole-3-glycerol phosphate synthase